MKREPEVSIFSVSVTLFGEHLAQAIDQLRLAVETPESKTHDEFRIEWRYATSSIIHGFSALDGLVNYLWFELFFNVKSEHFIAENERSFALKQLLKLWRRSSVLDKLNLILAETNSNALDSQYITKLNELNTFRNWLVHGSPYTIDYLEEKVWEGSQFTSTLHDREDNFERKKFPNAKFNSPASLNKEDAKTAIIIVLELITFTLGQIKWFHTILVTLHKGENKYWLGSDSKVQEILDKFHLN